jgi:hypothetical protein
MSFKANTNSGEKDISGNISTSYDAILETNYLTDLAVEEGLQDKNQDACKAIKES